MFILIERYINKMSIDDLNNLALSKNISLSDDELKFSFSFIKKNWKTVLGNFSLFDFDKYKDNFCMENFNKIKLLIKEYTLKYGSYLK